MEALTDEEKALYTIRLFTRLQAGRTGLLRNRHLQEFVGVVEDQTGLVLVGDVGVATVVTRTQCSAEAFEWTGLDDVVDTQVGFTLGLGRTYTGRGLDVVTVQVRGRSTQTRDTQTSEVIGVLTEVGVFTSTDEAANHAVGEQVEAGAAVTRVVAVLQDVALVQEHEAAVVADALVTQHERLTAQGVGEHGRPGGVVDFTRVTSVATVVVERVAGVAVLADGVAVEVTQVSLERLVVRDWQNVNQAEEVLLVVVLQLRVVVLQRQVFGDFPVATGETEFVAAASTTGHSQGRAVAGSTAVGVLQFTSGQGQAVDVLGRDDATVKGLRCHTAVVGQQNWQLWRQSTTDMQFGLGNTELQVGRCAAPGVNSRTVVVAREERVVVGVVTFTAIQVDSFDRLRVDTETDGALGEARLVVEFQGFCSFTLVSATGTVVGVVVHGPRADGSFAVFQKTISACLLGQQAQGHGESQARLVHVVLLNL